MKRSLMLSLALLMLANLAGAAVVTLNDGSSLSGDIKEQANGDIIVVTGAGEITVAKDKIRSVVKDGSAASAAPEGDMRYINKVLARREKYGNEDGIPHSMNLQKDQWAVTVGQLQYTGDAFLVKDGTGKTVLSASDLAGISYGLSWAHSFTDYVALETWGDYSYAAKDYTVGSLSTSMTIQRFNVGIGPKVQKAIRIGDAEQSMSLIPSFSLTPLYSSATGSTAGVSFNSSSVGASLNGGLDFQFGGALIGVRARYLVSSDVSSAKLNSSNTSAWEPQLNIGWAF